MAAPSHRFTENPYEDEATQRWGEEVVGESTRRVRSWSDEKAAAVERQGKEAGARLAELMRGGAPADDPRVQDAVDAHYAWITNFWTPDQEAYIGLGNLYIDDERFTANIDAEQPGLARYLRDAMTVYANARLT